MKHYCLSDALAQRLTGATWQLQEFGNQPNDGIVPVTSQQCLSSPDLSNVVMGGVHSKGTTGLGFNPPFELYWDTSAASIGIQIMAIFFLNESVKGNDFVSLY
jgi:hypothetical protein